MRDYRKLKAFQVADALALRVYEVTRDFPKDEQFGLRAQMRRAAVSVPSNIVEGSARESGREYLRFLDTAFASSQELAYQLTLATRLGFLAHADFESLDALVQELCRILNGLLRRLRQSAP
ncbi:MAG: four helix bundle protein [Candidatus Wallbacteria bacterium]|nr:four helix bundle protein [Candidatus Wallbacteria bacterium]